MGIIEGDWRYERHDDSPSEFPFAVMGRGEVIAWFKRSVDAEFVIRAVAEIVRLREDLIVAVEETRQRTDQVESYAGEVERLSRTVANLITEIARLSRAGGARAALERVSHEAIRELGRLTLLMRRRAA